MKQTPLLVTEKMSWFSKLICLKVVVIIKGTFPIPVLQVTTRKEEVVWIDSKIRNLLSINLSKVKTLLSSLRSNTILKFKIVQMSNKKVGKWWLIQGPNLLITYSVFLRIKAKSFILRESLLLKKSKECSEHSYFGRDWSNKLCNPKRKGSMIN